MPKAREKVDLSEVHRNKKLSPGFLAHSYKSAGEESCVRKITFRIPESMWERIKIYREQNDGESPWEELRKHLDDILPPLEND